MKKKQLVATVDQLEIDGVKYIGTFVDEGLDRAFPESQLDKLFAHVKYLKEIGYIVLM